MKKIILIILSLLLVANVASAAQYPASMYKVGSDLPAGEYVAIAADNAFIPMVTVKDGSGSEANILALYIFTTFSIVGAKDGQYVDVSDCYLIDIAESKEYVDSAIADTIADGTYKVGFHISPGEYKYGAVENSTLPMIAVYGDPYQASINNLVLPDGSGYITVKDGEYITLSDAYLLR